MPLSEPEDRGVAKVLVVERQIIVQPIEEERGVDEPIEEERSTRSARTWVAPKTSPHENVSSAESEPRSGGNARQPRPP